MPSLTYADIARTQEGIPFITGTQRKVEEVVLDHLAHHWDAHEIHRQHPYLSLAQIRNALAFYYDNQAEMDRRIDEGLRQVAEIRAGIDQSSIRLKLRAR